MKRNHHSKEFENQALIKVRERGDKSVRTVAQELHMPEFESGLRSGLDGGFGLWGGEQRQSSEPTC